MFGIGTPELSVIFMVFVVFILPFIVNARLAQSRGKNVALMLLLTIIFSWIVTLILACLPVSSTEDEAA